MHFLFSYTISYMYYILWQSLSYYALLVPQLLRASEPLLLLNKSSLWFIAFNQCWLHELGGGGVIPTFQARCAYGAIVAWFSTFMGVNNFFIIFEAL